MERVQSEFLRKKDEFICSTYRWPLDPLYAWSRRWEYPYVFHHLSAWRERRGANASRRVVDLGSGITFFPFFLAKAGWDVACADIDPVPGRCFPRAVQSLSAGKGVEFRLIAGSTLPFADEEADAVYCVSVLEHVPDFAQTVKEVARVLRPGGLFVLTVDVDMAGGSHLGVEEFGKLRTTLEEHFEYLFPETTTHPADLLDSVSGPGGSKSLPWQRRIWAAAKQHVLKPLFGKAPTPSYPHLAVYGAAMQRRDG